MLGLGLEGIKEDSMIHNFGGPIELKDGEFFDPIILLNAGEYQEEVIRRKGCGGISINRRGNFFEYNSKGNCVPTKRFWVRNIKEDGKPQEYLARIEREIKEGDERCRTPGEGKLGESATRIQREVISISTGSQLISQQTQDLIEGTGEREQGRKRKEDWQGTIDNDAIQAMLKNTMAGSMREVIKDELQAWLGLKCKQGEQEEEVREV